MSISSGFYLRKRHSRGAEAQKNPGAGRGFFVTLE